MLKLSLIIPVYNEEHHIKGCLDAVKSQIVAPDEVIVVDNNCTDKTIEIAKKYDFVRIITEKKQGRGFSRSAGFNHAENEILGRIDADSRIANNWVELVKQRFSEDSQLAGITGLGRTAFLPGINSLKSTFYSRNYYRFVHAGFNTITMWGANMAITRKYWLDVKNKVSLDDVKLHEDQDLSLWIASIGGKIIQDNNLLIETNGQGFRYLPKLIRYDNMRKNTYKLHKEIGNLDNGNVIKLGFWNTILGRFWSIIVSIPLIMISILLFPIDYFVYKNGKKTFWLD